MIVDFEQDPTAPFGTGNFRDDSGKIMYAYDPDTASEFSKTMRGSGLGKKVADESTFAAQKQMGDPGTSLRDEVSLQSDAIARGRFGGNAPSRGPDLRLAQNDRLGEGGLSPEQLVDAVGGVVPPGAPEPPPAPTAEERSAGAAEQARTQQMMQPEEGPPAPPSPELGQLQEWIGMHSAATLPANANAPAAPSAAQPVSAEPGLGRGAMETSGRQTTQGDTVAYGRPLGNVQAQQKAERPYQLDTNNALREQGRAEDERVDAGYRAQQQGVQNTGAMDVAQGFEAKRQQLQLQKDIEKLNQEFRANENSYDPDRFVRNMSTGKRVAMVILAALNGGFGALTGAKSNTVLDLLNTEIERDIDRQKQQIAGRRTLIGNKISEYLRKGYKMEDAEQLAGDHLRSGLIAMAKLESERQGMAGKGAQNAEVLIQQLEEQRANRRSDQLAQTEDRRQSVDNTVTTEQSKTGGVSAKDYLELLKTKTDLERSQLALDNDRTKSANTAQMAVVLNKRISPDEADKIQERVQQVGPGLAETSGLVAALKNVIETTGSKLDETNGKPQWGEDLKGVGFLDKDGGYASFIPGSSLARKYGLWHPEVDKVRAAQDALIQYLATNITGATFTPEQLRTFTEQAGGLDVNNEAAFKEKIGNLLQIVFSQRNAQMARLGPDGQAWYRYSQMQANQGSQAPPLVPRDANAAGAPEAPAAPAAPAPALPGAPPAAPQAPAQPPTAPGLTPELENVINQGATSAGLDPDKIIRVINFETNGSFSPSTVAVNSPNHAGMLQWGKPEWAEAARLAGSPQITWEQAQAMTPEQQLPFVYAYLAGKGLTAQSSLGDYYMALAAPAMMSAPPGTVVYPRGSDEVRVNPAWDTNRDGQVTNDELRGLNLHRPRPVAAVPPLVKRG